MASGGPVQHLLHLQVFIRVRTLAPNTPLVHCCVPKRTLQTKGWVTALNTASCSLLFLKTFPVLYIITVVISAYDLENIFNFFQKGNTFIWQNKKKY